MAGIDSGEVVVSYKKVTCNSNLSAEEGKRIYGTMSITYTLKIKRIGENDFSDVNSITIEFYISKSSWPGSNYPSSVDFTNYAVTNESIVLNKEDELKFDVNISNIAYDDDISTTSEIYMGDGTKKPDIEHGAG